MVLSRWLRSFKHGNDYIKLIDSDSYYAAYGGFVARVLGNPATIVRIATLIDDDDNALGFSVVRGTILDYVHVHKDHRRQGIGRHLVPQDIDTFTHITRIGLRLWSVKLPQAILDPFR
jgi:GNAT superfamily N-acetyltransferase